MKVVIERSKWLRGEGSISSLLRARDQKMCCLGFACEQAGLPSSAIANRASPREVFTARTIPALAGLLLPNFYDDNAVCCRLMELNDSPALSEGEREAQLAAKAVEAGLEFEFID